MIRRLIKALFPAPTHVHDYTEIESMRMDPAGAHEITMRCMCGGEGSLYHAIRLGGKWRNAITGHSCVDWVADWFTGLVLIKQHDDAQDDKEQVTG